MTRRQRRDHVGVHRDLAEAVAYYQQEAPEQVNRLLDLFEQRVGFLARYPFTHPFLFEDFRHVVLTPFDYMVVYAVEEETIDVLALLHAKRGPEHLQQEVRDRTFD